MTIGTFLLLTAIGLGVFFVVDLLWLGVVAQKLYDYFIGEFLRETPIWSAAIIFYTLYIAVVIFFAVRPALEASNSSMAFLYGAILGGFGYMTYELTNFAVHRDWPLGIVIIDIAWGIVLTSIVSGVTYLIAKNLLAL